MVFAFIIQNVSPLSPKILFSQIFSFPNDDSQVTREDRKKLLNAVAARVESECEFERSANRKNIDEALEQVMDGVGTKSTIPQADTGIFSIAADRNHNLFPTPVPLIVVWSAQLHVAFSFVINKHENRLLATNNLKILCNRLVEDLGLLLQPKNALLYPDKIQNIVDQFLPNGQLLFMNHKILKQFEKELDRIK